MRAVRTLVTVLVLSMLTGCAWIERSSVSSSPAAVEGNGSSGGLTFLTQGPSVSQSGRFVAFTSGASNLVAGDANGLDDVFVHDHVTGVTELVSIATTGAQGDRAAGSPSISDDGRFVAFVSSSILIPDPPERVYKSRIFVRDRQLGTTVLADFPGIEGGTGLPTISGNGRFVAFVLDTQFPDLNGGFRAGPFVRDLVLGTTKRMPDGGGGVDSSILFDSAPSLSDDGSRVTYSWILPPDPNQVPATTTFATVVADTATATVVATVDSGTITSAGPQARFESAISGDGTKVAYFFGPGDNATLFRYDLHHPGLVPILTDVPSPRNLGLSDDGSIIGFRRVADYVITTLNGSTPRVVSADTLGHPASSLHGNADLSGDGQWLTFASSDPALVQGDTNGVSDLYLRSNRVDGRPPS